VDSVWTVLELSIHVFKNCGPIRLLECWQLRLCKFTSGIIAPAVGINTDVQNRVLTYLLNFLLTYFLTSLVTYLIPYLLSYLLNSFLTYLIHSLLNNVLTY